MSNDAFTARAREYWTPERTRALIGDKPLLLTPTDAAPLLRALGLLQRDASMPPPQVRKFRQINHMLLSIEPGLKDLMTGAPLRIIDAGCGGSYLTLLLAWYLREHRDNSLPSNSGLAVKGYPAHIVGIDRNAALLDKCRQRAESLGLSIDYQVGAIEDHRGDSVDLLVALHACDTATDDALALGLRLHAQMIAVVPCCQAELAAKCAAQAGPLGPMWGSPHLRRLAGSTLTDTLRLLLLRREGYDATAMEFVPTEHTPKNTMIRARKRRDFDVQAAEEYAALCALLQGRTIKLHTLLEQASNVAQNAHDAKSRRDERVQ